MSQPSESGRPRVPELGAFRLGAWMVRQSEGALSSGDRSLRLEPRVMDVLICLAAEPGKVVAKEALLEMVWGGAYVEEGALSQAVHSLRKALEDDARQPRYVQTLPKRGYRLIAPVVVEADAGAVLKPAPEAPLVPGAPPEPVPNMPAWRRLLLAFRRQPRLSSARPVVAEGVRKRYGFGKPVLDGVDLTIERGSIYALLGRNGCGKTTFLRTLLGIYRRDAGRVSIFGEDPEGGNPRLFARVGFVPDVLAIDERMRVREALDFVSHFYPRWDQAYCHRLLSRYDLPLETAIRSLSRGMQTKVSLVLALAHRPELLVMDDPTLGLDAIVLAELVETLQAVRDEGVTVLLASHNYEELDGLATHAGLFRNGRIEMSDRLDALRRRVREMSSSPPEPSTREPSLREIFVRLLH